jgi:hypothetical protein
MLISQPIKRFPLNLKVEMPQVLSNQAASHPHYRTRKMNFSSALKLEAAYQSEVKICLFFLQAKSQLSLFCSPQSWRKPKRRNLGERFTRSSC